MQAKKDSNRMVPHYDAHYGNFQSEVYTQIRLEALGKDFGELSAGKTLLDIVCRSGGPSLRIADGKNVFREFSTLQEN
jgi:hypothetical protein